MICDDIMQYYINVGIGAIFGQALNIKQQAIYKIGTNVIYINMKI